VVVGAGYGGATAAKYLSMWSRGTIDVTLVEPDAEFVSCPMSNLVLGGNASIQDVTMGYAGLRDRGVLRPGAHADLAVFDPLAFREEGTTFDPSRLASGMDTVIVNGALTLAGGRPTGTRAGRVLRRV